MVKKDSNGRSHKEVITNTTVAFIVGLALNLFFLPYFTEDLKNQDIGVAVFISIVFTIVSYWRSFSLRRLFNKIYKRKDSSGKSHSEAITNIGVGYTIAMFLNLTFLAVPVIADGLQVQNMGIALLVAGVYNIVSYWRSFFIRRIFNKFKRDASFGKFFHQVKNGEIKIL
jgi:O-antigen/teichoic acid export membrane protein